MNDSIEFGQFVRSFRLAKSKTARDVSQSAEMLPSNFSKLEHGALNPPNDPNKQKRLALALGITAGSPEEAQFFDLAAKANNSVPVDISDIISEEDAIPLLLRTIGNKRLGKADIQRLVEIVRGTAGAKKLQ